MEINKKSDIARRRRQLFLNIIVRRERTFVLMIALFFLIAGMFYSVPAVAMWIGFGLAAYSAVANDSIQTLGTFIASNHKQKWWILWLFIGGIFIVTVSISWVINDGDVSYQRLMSKGFTETPTSFHFLQIAAPIFLLILTRLKIPVSTTFLLLSSFSSSSNAITGVMMKSMTGYIIAFSFAFFTWLLLNKVFKKLMKGKESPGWRVAQWITTGFLWSLWLIQDAANIAVFLPRSLNSIEFLVFVLVIFVGLGIIFFLKGDKIQKIVTEKTEVKDVRPATMIDFVYVLILIIFTWVNTVPMSTTWVFLGLLGGRELGLKLRSGEKLAKTRRIILTDLSYALIGLFVSIILALSANEHVRNEVFSLIGIY